MTSLEDRLDEAVRVLRDGGLVAFPTETVYGLGADATSAEAVARIYAAKGRPAFNPLIAHVGTLDAARREAVFDARALALAERFWPGPLTLVLPRAATGTVCDLACAGLHSIALRLPAHPLARALIERAGRPIAAPSANRSGRLSPTSAEAVHAELGARIDLLLDGGDCTIGLESTIVACAENRVTLLRAGGLPRETLESALGTVLETAEHGRVSAPGMLASHYAPNARLRLAAAEPAAGEAYLDFGGRIAHPDLDLSPSGDLNEAAANLYSFLRRLDARGAATIAVAPIPNTGLGLAINDRLRRAAAPRPSDEGAT